MQIKHGRLKPKIIMVSVYENAKSDYSFFYETSTKMFKHWMPKRQLMDGHPHKMLIWIKLC